MNDLNGPQSLGSHASRSARIAALPVSAAFVLLAALGAGSVRAQALEAVAGGAPKDGQKVVLITGSTGGLGREVARRVAATGAHVIVHGRNLERGTSLVQEIEQAGTGGARFYAADFASLADVRRFGAAILRDYTRIDVLVNNAGIWLEGNERELSADGVEMHFAVNYLAGYLLTRMLLPRIRESAPARIVNVSSGAQSPIDFDDPMLANGYSDGRGYATSKLAQVMLTFDLAQELANDNVIVVALHPATMMNTDMVLERGARPRSTIAEGAEAVMHLITGSGIESGQYFNGQRPARANAQAYDAGARAQLKALSERLVGGG